MTLLGGLVCAGLILGGAALLTNGQGEGLLLVFTGLWASIVVVFS